MKILLVMGGHVGDICSGRVSSNNVIVVENVDAMETQVNELEDPAPL